MSGDDVEIVRRLHEAWNRGDYPGALDLIDPEVVAEFAIGADGDGIYRGHDELTKGMAGFWSLFDDPHTEVVEAFPAGDGVVAQVRFSGRGRKSGVLVDLPAWHFWKMRDGKAVRWVVARTKEQVLEEAGLSA